VIASYREDEQQRQQGKDKLSSLGISGGHVSLFAEQTT
jgi:hypothetical protein